MIEDRTTRRAGRRTPGAWGPSIVEPDFDEQPFVIRRAQRLDALSVARVHVQAWRETYANILPPRLLEHLSINRATRQHAQRMADRSSATATFVAVQPGRGIVGFGICGARRQGPVRFLGEIQALYLVADVTGLGLGRRIVARMAGWLDSQGMSSALAWVLTENRPARRFYGGLGGMEFGTQPFRMQQATLFETGYGWDDLTDLMMMDAPPIGQLMPFLSKSRG